VIAHVLRFSFKDGTSEEDFATAMQAFRRTAQAATVSFAVVGPYLGNPADGYTHSAIFGLAGLETLERFMYEPAHREADFIVHPHMAKFDGFDVSDEYDPDLDAKILDIQRRRIAADPELAALLSG
jgi:stress responsive alpha/beta barrel protein